MLGASHHIIKFKTILIAISLLMVVVKFSDAQEANEHIHAADAVMKQTFTKNVSTGSASFVLDTFNDTFAFALEKNVQLLDESYSLDDNVELYKGKLLGVDNSWARFTNVNGVMDGAFFDGNDLFLVKGYRELSSLLDANALNSQESLQAETEANTSLIINVNDIQSSGTCALHDDEANLSQFENANNQDVFSYNNYVNDLVEMSGAQAGKQIPISLFADEEFSSASSNATSEMLSLLNVADGIYSEQIGVQFVLTEARALTNNGALTSTDPIKLIVAFRNTGLSNPGVSHLFTAKDLVGSTVGIAYVGSLCRQSSVGLTQKFGSKTSIIFAHELGHNFGAPHDSESGSACSSTSSGYVMYPNVNSGSSTFSSCSIAQMQPVIDYATNGSGACITVTSAQSPTITSTANLTAKVDEVYSYDSDNTLDITGTGPFTFTLDIAPQGMSINSNGKIAWTPTGQQAGTNTVQVRASNNQGSDVQIFDINVTQVKSGGFIDFSQVSISSYGKNQDTSGGAKIGSSSNELILTGNTWKSIPFKYNVTSNTILQFEFESNKEGEIQGIAFDNDNNIGEKGTFNVFGSQSYGEEDIKYTKIGSKQTITIPVGKYIKGNFDRLAFILDNDALITGADSIFSNVIVFEENGAGLPTVTTVDFNNLQVVSHLPNTQDMDGIYEIIEQGNGIRIEGNTWQKVDLGSVSITPSTVITFDFKVEKLSEIHGIGFYEGNHIDKADTIQLAGSQPYGHDDYKYTQAGKWQSFTIPIGKYLTSKNVKLTFISDDDANIGSNTNIRNIEFISQ